MDHGDLEMHIRSNLDGEAHDLIPWSVAFRGTYQLAGSAARQRRALDERRGGSCGDDCPVVLESLDLFGRSGLVLRGS
jgi:hypothetical protein